ncbi:MAG TPA: hypothetical protein VFC07_10815 [Verrucomicrobiae bacterium]|nr:hypothetical protein [Verrucomicrobiae bacterium]
MRWKTWILAFLAFASLCILTDLAFTHGVILRTPLSDSSRIRHLYDDNSNDIPIFGTSKAHGNYCPADMGLGAFNYGIDGASYEVTDVLLQIELAKRRTTPIIIELQHVDTGTLGYQGSFIPFVSDPKIRQLLTRFHAMQWRYYLPGIRYFGHYETFLQQYLNGRMRVQKVNQGFSELVHPPPFDRAKLDEFVRGRLETRTGYFTDEDLNRRLMAQITAHPQRLFFLVVSPYHPSYFTHFQNADKLATFEEKLTVLPNVVLLDWSRLDYPDEYFLDTLHLRRQAAAKFSRKLGDKIREILRARSEQASAGKTGAE